MFETASFTRALGSFARDERGDSVEHPRGVFDIRPFAAEKRGVPRSHVVSRGRRRDRVVELDAESGPRDVGDAHRLGRQVHQRKPVPNGDLQVAPEPRRIIELEHTARIDLLNVVVVQEVEDDVLLESGAVETGQPHDRRVETRRDSFLEQTAVAAVGVKTSGRDAANPRPRRSG